ncbi:MAG: zf-TFIIB domain-containing protein [Actinomycetota bacterium]
MQCPLCIETVLEPRFHGPVEIDVCPKCKGVWLDRGELQKLVDASEPRSERRRPDDRDWDDERDDRAKRDRDDRDKRDRGDKGKKKKKKGKKSLGDRLADALDDVLDFDFD